MKSSLRPAGLARHLILAFALVPVLFGACNDPYSRNRIAKRENHIREFDQGVRESEARRAVRLREAGETLDAWWIQDVNDYNRRMRSIGDYIW